MPAAPLVHPQGDLEFVVIEDPIDEPVAPYVSLGYYRTAGGGDKLPIRSIDVLRWDNPGINYNFKALGTDSARVYSTTSERPVDGPMITRVVREDRTYLRRIDFSGGDVLGRSPFDYVTGLGRFDIFGLSFQVAIRNVHYHYLKYDTADEVWRIPVWSASQVRHSRILRSQTDRDIPVSYKSSSCTLDDWR